MKTTTSQRNEPRSLIVTPVQIPVAEMVSTLGYSCGILLIALRYMDRHPCARFLSWIRSSRECAPLSLKIPGRDVYNHAGDYITTGIWGTRC